ncbi:MAG: hypothetical protein DWQ08_01535, partial [Proteobacteria bacterium]
MDGETTDTLNAPDNDEDANLLDELLRLRALLWGRADSDSQLRRLARFPEENPNPVIELNLFGKATYLNPSAWKRFPELWELGGEHPLIRDLGFPIVSRH